MANKILSALSQAMGAMDKYVTNPMILGGSKLLNQAQNVAGDAYKNYRNKQDAAYEEKWSKIPHTNLSPLSSPTPIIDDTDSRMQKNGFEKIAENEYQKKDPKTGFVSKIKFGTPQQKPSPTPTPTGAIPQVAPQINSPQDGGRITDTFKYQMGLDKYPEAKRQLQAMYQAKGNPPMAQYVDQFVAMGEKYKVDPRILATIAQIESSGGRNYPPQSYNPFGYLGGDGPTVADKLNAGFTSVPHAIEALTRRFSSRYPEFIKNPTPAQLQQSYNATPSEKQRYLDLMTEILPYMQ